MNFGTMLSQLSLGMLESVLIFLLTLIFALPLGLIVCAGRMAKNRVIKGITTFFISVLRGTPLMLQLLVVYFFPYYLFGWSIRGWRFPALVVGFVLNYAAYFAAFSLSYMEMFTVAKQIAASNTTFMPFVVAAVFYYVFNLLVTFVMGRLEKKFNFGK